MNKLCSIKASEGGHSSVVCGLWVVHLFIVCVLAVFREANVLREGLSGLFRPSVAGGGDCHVSSGVISVRGRQRM